MNKVTQSIYKNAVDNSLFDNERNFRFIGGDGTPLNVSGMTVSSSKWVLNGTNLTFEIIGTFSNDINEPVTICTFNLPEFISSKIMSTIGNIIDVMLILLISDTGEPTTCFFRINKDNNTISFIANPPLGISGNSGFRIRYNTIIDNE